MFPEYLSLRLSLIITMFGPQIGTLLKESENITENELKLGVESTKKLYVKKTIR